MPSKIRHLLRQKILHEVLTSTSASGTNVFAEGVTIRGRIAEADDLVTDEKGRHIVSSTRLYTEAPVKQGDQLTYKGNVRIAGKVVQRLNRVGKLDHLEVYLE
jgi:hypothetical protein